jgi:hypothetical protein
MNQGSPQPASQQHESAPVASVPGAASSGATSARNECAGPINIFASHSHEYEDLARDFKRDVESIQSRVPLKVSIYEAMFGGRKWRPKLQTELRQADIFVLLYPHADMKLSWCSYELGMFHGGGDRPIVCLRNTDIPVPLDLTDEWQDYLANVGGIKKFLVELFCEGAFTSGVPIFSGADTEASGVYARIEQSAINLSRSFERARIKRNFYMQRICIQSEGDPSKGFDLETDLDRAVITGEERALHVLSLNANAKWAALVERLEQISPSPQWPSELPEAFKSVKSGPIPPPLTPFRSEDGKVYLPVITRADSIDQQVRRAFMIFVEANPRKMHSFFDMWVPYGDVAATWTALIRSTLILLRARWKTILPMLMEVRDAGSDEDAAKAVIEKAREGFDAIDKELRSVDLIESYREILDEALEREGHSVEDEYLQIKRELRSATGPYTHRAAELMERWATSNTRHIRFVAKVFAVRADRLTNRKVARSGM